jgi:hypothetical protein
MRDSRRCRDQSRVSGEAFHAADPTAAQRTGALRSRSGAGHESRFGTGKTRIRSRSAGSRLLPCAEPLAIGPYCAVDQTLQYPRDLGGDFVRAIQSNAAAHLILARCGYWESGEIPKDLQQLWEEARRLIPDWPGFQRMRLTQAQKRAVPYVPNSLIPSKFSAG